MRSTGLDAGGGREAHELRESPHVAHNGGVARAPARELGQRTTASFGIWPWLELARRNGVPLEPICDEADVSLASLRDLGLRFSQATANRIAELACEQFGPSAAMAATLTVEAGQFSLLELLARTAPTVADGLVQGTRFFPLIHDGGTLRHERLGGGTHALRWYPPEGYVVHYGYIELTFGVVVRGIQRETGRNKLFPAEVWFRHAAPEDRSLYQRVLGKNVRFSMPYDQLVLSAASAALPLSRKNIEIHRVATALASDLLDEE